MRFVFPLLTLLACDGVSKDSDTEDEVAVVCNPGSSWSAGTPAFRDATDDWGLTDMAPVGIRMSAVDFDGDGWPDLTVRGSTTSQDFENGTQTVWLLRNKGDGTFEDVTQASRIAMDRDSDDDNTGNPGSVWVWADVDNDGDLDVYTGLPDQGGQYEPTSEVRLNNGDGTFSIMENGDHTPKRSDPVYGAAFTDVDLDGYVDLWTGHYGAEQDILYTGNGSKFKEASDVGLDTVAWSSVDDINQALGHSNAWGATACDLNDDGAPELLVPSYGRAPNHLWLNDGTGLFSNHSIESGYAFDENQDWSDNESARCYCLLNPDEDDCEGVPAPAYITCNDEDDAFRWSHRYDREPYRLGGNSGATACRDLDNDGDIDLLTSEIVHWDVGQSSDVSEILLNDGSATFTRPGNDATGLTREHDGITWDDGDITNGIFDFDNDGWPDVWIGSSDYEGTRGLLYHQVAPGEFEYVDPSDGVDHTRAHGSVFADFDRDGDLDAVFGHSSARCSGYDDCYDSKHVRFWENLTEDSNWLQLDLRATGNSNAAAIGAKVVVTSDSFTQTQYVSGGGGQFGTQDDLVLHYGLGPDCEAEVEVRWPDADGTTETFTVGGGYRYTIVQGEGIDIAD